MKLTIGCVIQGKGERESVGILLRRAFAAIDPRIEPVVPEPVRKPRSTLLKGGELERAVLLAASNAGPSGAVLVLMDSDDDCPARLGPVLLDRARRGAGFPSIMVVLANREFEAWFLAAAESLRGRRGLRQDLECPPDPESVRGAKEWLSERMTTGHSYRPTLDQPALTASFDLSAARRVPSFARFWRELERIATKTPGLSWALKLQAPRIIDLWC